MKHVQYRPVWWTTICRLCNSSMGTLDMEEFKLKYGIKSPQVVQDVSPVQSVTPVQDTTSEGIKRYYRPNSYDEYDDLYGYSKPNNRFSRFYKTSISMLEAMNNK